MASGEIFVPDRTSDIEWPCDPISSNKLVKPSKYVFEPKDVLS